jgi:hypothetical protein
VLSSGRRLFLIGHFGYLGCVIACSLRVAFSAERTGELPAEPGVLVGECLVALEGGGEPGAQRGVGCPLACRDGASRLAVAGAAQPLDLVADVGLGVEAGPGDAGCGSDRGERYGPP